MNVLKHVCLFLLMSNTLIFASSHVIDKRFSKSAPVASVSGSDALWHNPAGLYFMGGEETSVRYLYELSEPGNRHHAGFGLAFNFLKALSVGVGINTQAAFSEPGKTNLGTDLSGVVGLAFKLSQRSSFGISLFKSHSFLKKAYSDTLVTFGTQVRPWSFLSMGAYYQELHKGFFSAPNLALGLSFRPLKELLTIGVDAKWVPKTPLWGDGFALHPIVSIGTMYKGLGASLSAEIPDINQGWSKPIFSMSLDINFAHLGFSVQSFIDGAHKNYGFGGSIRTSSEEWESVTPPKDMWVSLALDSNGALEQTTPSLFERLFGEVQSPLSVLALLKRLESDPAIKGILLSFSGFSFGDGRAQEWRDAIRALRRAQKEVVIYLDAPSERDYYIATAANLVYMNKDATLSLRRFQATLVYFADLLNKIGIKADSVTAGTFKTAPRQWTHARPQKEEIEVMNNILHSFYDQLIDDTSVTRNIEKAKLKELFDKGEITASSAYEAGLVDRLIAPVDIFDALNQEPGYPKPFFAHYENRKFKQESWRDPRKIVVIPITHTLVDGYGEAGIFSTLFPETYAKDVIDLIEAAAQDPDVLGIIIRIDSPGGDALAGSRITEALKKAQKIKPIVTSMSDVAASAGYMIAAGTNHILALPNTLTGSIGVFSLMFSGEKLADKVGIFAKELKAIKSPGPTIYRSATDAERQEAQHVVDWYYRNFIKTVSLGLGIDEQEVTRQSDGRVWLGSEALEKKLVHELGGFSQAVEAILLLADVAKDEHVAISIMNPGMGANLSFGARLLSLFSQKDFYKDISVVNTIAKPYLEAVKVYKLAGQPQARLPFDISWRTSP